jgi:serine-type D-Ala-D-Ala carboxypeptidase (penicillin-binding protein 5/6)
MRYATDTGREAVAALRLLVAILVAVAVWPAALAAQEKGDNAPAQKPPAQPPAQPAKPGGPPQLDARTWILVDPRDGEVLAAKSPHKSRAIASATKLMTAYVAVKKLKPSRTLRAAPYNAAPIESVLGLRTGERMRVRDLLYGLLMVSGNDAAVTLATGAAGSVPRFVEQMNRQAAALGLESTSYTNPVGLDDPGNYSSAADLATLATEALENPLLARIADTATTTLRSGDRPRRLTTRNTLLLEDPSVDGVKTGLTQNAGYVLVGSATRDGTQLVSAVLGAPSEAARDAETEELLEYGFSLYSPSTPVTRGEELADPDLDYRDETLPLVAARAVEVSARDAQAVETRVKAPDELSGDIEEGERLGSVAVTVDGRPAGSSPLVAARSVDAATLTDKVVAQVQNPLILVPLGAIVILVGLLLAVRGRRHRAEQPATDPVPEAPTAAEPRQERRARSRRDRKSSQRTPEERRKMHEERMRRRRERGGS